MALKTPRGLTCQKLLRVFGSKYLSSRDNNFFQFITIFFVVLRSKECLLGLGIGCVNTARLVGTQSSSFEDTRVKEKSLSTQFLVIGTIKLELKDYYFCI